MLQEYGIQCEFTGFNKLFQARKDTSDEIIVKKIKSCFIDAQDVSWHDGDEDNGSYLVIFTDGEETWVTYRNKE